MELFTNMCRLVHHVDLIALLYEHLEFNIRRGQVVKLWAVAHVHVMVPEVLVWLGYGSGTQRLSTRYLNNRYRHISTDLLCKTGIKRFFTGEY